MSQDSITAGVDTTSVTATFLLLDLANNQEKQELLYQEIMEHVGNSTVAEHNLAKMRYLRACLQESQRLNPAVFALTRTTQVDMTLSGYNVPANVNVVYPMMLTMKDPTQFPNPNEVWFYVYCFLEFLKLLIVVGWSGVKKQHKIFFSPGV